MCATGGAFGYNVAKSRCGEEDGGQGKGNWSISMPVLKMLQALVITELIRLTISIIARVHRMTSAAGKRLGLGLGWPSMSSGGSN